MCVYCSAGARLCQGRRGHCGVCAIIQEPSHTLGHPWLLPDGGGSFCIQRGQTQRSQAMSHAHRNASCCRKNQWYAPDILLGKGVGLNQHGMTTNEMKHWQMSLHLTGEDWEHEARPAIQYIVRPMLPVSDGYSQVRFCDEAMSSLQRISLVTLVGLGWKYAHISLKCSKKPRNEYWQDPAGQLE